MSVPTAPRPDRIDGRRLRSERAKQVIIEAYLSLLVETRAATCERGVALWRVLLASVAEDKELVHRVRISRDRTVDRLELMYRPELSTLPEPERRYLLIALEAVTDIESWARMREQHGLSFDEACAVWMNVIDRLLPTLPHALDESTKRVELR